MMNLFHRLLFTLTVAALLSFPSFAQPKHALMQDAHTLVFNHESITRVVEKLPDGVRTKTTTSDPDMVEVLRKHPREMVQLYQQGGMVRGWDPLFRELASVSDKVKMEASDIEGGVEVLVTSEDAEVVKLIHAHAEKVSDMAKRGVDAMHEATALPSGYVQPVEQNANAGEQHQEQVESSQEVSKSCARLKAGTNACCAAGGQCCGRARQCSAIKQKE